MHGASLPRALPALRQASAVRAGLNNRDARCILHPVPKRIQLRRTKGFRLPATARNVARPTVWGNDFVVGEPHPMGSGPLTREQAIDLFTRTLSPSLLQRARAELAGFDLACWCPLDKPCHADVWLRLVNEESPAMPDSKRYAFSLNQEEFHGDCATREEAVSEAVSTYALEVEATVYTGEIAPPVPSRFAPGAERVIDWMVDEAMEAHGDLAESWLENVPLDQQIELENAIDAAIDAWATKHKLQPKFFGIDNCRKHTVTENDGAVPADDKKH
jgi:hypothetical protein